MPVSRNHIRLRPDALQQSSRFTGDIALEVLDRAELGMAIRSGDRGSMQRLVKALLHVIDRRLVLGALHPQRKKYRITCSITSSGSATSTTSPPSPTSTWASRPDLSVPVLGVDRAVEVKCCADGFRERYGWLDERDILIVKADRREPLVVLRLSLAAEIAKPRAE